MSDAEKKEWVVYGKVTLNGAYMIVEAETKEEAMRIADKSPAFETHSAETIDWETTGAELNE